MGKKGWIKRDSLEFLEQFLFIIVRDKSVFEDFAHAAPPLGNRPSCVRAVLPGSTTRPKSQTTPSPFIGAMARDKTILAGEIMQIKANGRINFIRQHAWSRRSWKNCPERRTARSGVAVKPIELAAIDGVENAVLAGDFRVEQRLGDGRLEPEQYRVAINALAGDAVKAFGDVEAFDF